MPVLQKAQVEMLPGHAGLFSMHSALYAAYLTDMGPPLLPLLPLLPLALLLSITLIIMIIGSTDNENIACPCVYDRRKQKPGLKSGAVESLNQRICQYSSSFLTLRISWWNR